MGARRWSTFPGSTSTASPPRPETTPTSCGLENLDTDITPPAAAVEATREAVGTDEANSWLPFTGRDDLKEAVAAYDRGPRRAAYDGRREIVITSGEGTRCSTRSSA